VILIGGCGLYLKNFRYISSKILKKNENIIKHFFLKKKQNKLQNIYKKFIEINSNIKKKISQNDTIRIIQNLEKYYLRKEKLNNLKQLTNLIKSIKNTNWISFWPNRYSLKKKIKNRAKKMFLFGILKEGAILKKELPETCFLLSTMGYKEALMYIKGVISKKNAIKKTTIRHNQYAKKQFIWFKKEKWWKKIWPFEK
jgi:tRNA dimethylallyltransferase